MMILEYIKIIAPWTNIWDSLRTEKTPYTSLYISKYYFETGRIVKPTILSNSDASKSFVSKLRVQALPSLKELDQLIPKISGHVENSRAFSRYRDIDEEMAKETIMKLE